MVVLKHVVHQRWFSYSAFSFKFNRLFSRKGLNSRATDDDPYNFVLHSFKMCVFCYPSLGSNEQAEITCEYG